MEDGSTLLKLWLWFKPKTNHCPVCGLRTLFMDTMRASSTMLFQQIENAQLSTNNGVTNASLVD